ncbi:hyaluronan and proteoglycan link protein 2 isoform X2 [Takifugu rubripes]|uniref:hyaluronan and proteoglycan link protein 2 isoform X2 n=1 Tax=Takifugu rubripes TaxID=31033 RepID=UPI001145D1F8|nr:hyaluronan and proteoglycan link protein 2 isoform X2 [Takifugu rubripes]
MLSPDHVLTLSGAGATSIVMKCLVTLLLTSSCIASSSAPDSPNKAAAAPRTLKYLLEPPVYAEVVAPRGENVTLPCILRANPSQYTVKWTKMEVEKVGPENIIIISNGRACKRYGHLGPRASLRKAHVLDASLQLSRLELEDGGRYRCQLIHDLHDESVFISLRIEGVVFPYQSKNGRYRFTYTEAKQACEEQDGRLASQEQLYRAWTEGLDWCNAGWLWDGTVQYPIIVPRPACGLETFSGLRSYGSKDKEHHFDAFCFTSQTSAGRECLQTPGSPAGLGGSALRCVAFPEVRSL